MPCNIFLKSITIRKTIINHISIAQMKQEFIILVFYHFESYIKRISNANYLP